MHKNAIEYDRAHGRVTEFGNETQIPYDVTPKGRPCDWCGEPVDEGYIHDECLRKEADLWLDLLY